MKTEKVLPLDHRQVPLKIVYEGVNGKKRSYKIKPSADKCGIMLNKDEE